MIHQSVPCGGPLRPIWRVAGDKAAKKLESALRLRVRNHVPGAADGSKREALVLCGVASNLSRRREPGPPWALYGEAQTLHPGAGAGSWHDTCGVGWAGMGKQEQAKEAEHCAHRPRRQSR